MNYDPVLLAHARALLTSSEEGRCGYIDADLRNPGKILAEARQLLDFTEPVVLLLVAVLHFIPDEDDPHGLAAAYREPLPQGSYLVISHGTVDFHDPQVARAAAAACNTASARLVLRPRSAVEGFFDGFRLVEAGLVQAPLWRPATGPASGSVDKTGICAGLAFKD